MKQLEVQIMQQNYLLGCPEGQHARLLQAVERVDIAMSKIRDAGKVRARDRIAVLAALNLAFEIADREASLAQANVALAGTSQTVATAMPEDGSAASADAVRLHALIRRLDEALETDSRLA